MTKVAVIFGSSRPSNVGEAVAKWFVGEVEPAEGIEFEMIDLAELNLPMISEPMPPMMGQYQQDSTKKWAERVSAFDAFVVVAAEYNHSYTPIVKNALDTLYSEWNDKHVAVLSYGAGGGANAFAALKPVFEALQMKLSDKTLQVTKAYEAVDENGKLKTENVSGDSPQEIADSIGG